MSSTSVAESALERNSQFFKANPQPPRDDAPYIPEASANFMDLLTFGWMTPLLSLGYSRPLEASDLYVLQPERGAAYVADKIDASLRRRQKAAEDYNARLARGDLHPGPLNMVLWMLTGEREEKEKRWRELGGRKNASLAWALNDSIKWWFWSGGVLKVVGDTAQVMSPLLVKVQLVMLYIWWWAYVQQAIINFATDSYAGHKLGTPVPSVGLGIGYAFGLVALQVIESVCTHHFFYRATSTGVLLRGGLITAIYNRTLKLTSRARSTLTNGILVNHISTDVSRIDFCAGYFHMATVFHWVREYSALIT